MEEKIIEIVESDSNPGIQQVMTALERCYDPRPLAVVFQTSEGPQILRIRGLDHASGERGVFNFVGYLREEDGSFRDHLITGLYNANWGTGWCVIHPKP